LSQEFELMVVGSGIAGLSAALAAARLGRSTLLLTGDTLGGHLLSIERIDGYPGFPDGIPGYELCPIVQEQAQTAGAEVSMAAVTGLSPSAGGWQVDAATGPVAAKAVIVASGTQFLELGVPGESLLRGKGVSQCASCDAPLLGGKEVVVAGGGDSALQEALTLAEHCSRVTVVHHGTALTGQAAYRQLAESNDRIELCPESEIGEILGSEAVTGVRIRSTVTDASREIECASVFTFIGLRPNTAFMDHIDVVDDDGRIVTDSGMRTTRAGLLAAGTVRTASPGRAAAGSGDGTTAALSADQFLASGAWP
jgi:thioredoxin reductase (NADPH)